MRLHTEKSDAFIQTLITSISKDPASFENWCCLQIKHQEGTQIECRDSILKGLKAIHTDVNCDVIQCADNDVLFISRRPNDESLDILANAFTQAALLAEGAIAECVFYDVFRDWQSIAALLQTKNYSLHAQSLPRPSHHFGEIASLEDVFAEAKKLRKARLPLHVMVVEDDTLTRRLVTSAFKEQYAMISATNAQEAVANYLLHAPDIVFLDIGLPDVSGFEVLHQIMANDPNAYVVMFSSNSYLDNITAALSNGASGFIPKPFKKEKMHHYIQDSADHHRKYSS